MLMLVSGCVGFGIYWPSSFMKSTDITPAVGAVYTAAALISVSGFAVTMREELT